MTNDPTEVTIGDHDLRIGQMPVRKQFHVARRLAPLFSSFIGQGESGLRDGLAGLQIQPIADALSGMKDEDCDYVLDACLSVVTVKQGDRYSPLMKNGQMMFQNITLPEMLQIASEVVMKDLAGFMAGVGSTSAAPSAA